MRFYVLDKFMKGSAHNAITQASESGVSRLGKPPECKACGGILGMKEWLPPFEVVLEAWGEEYGDFAFPVGNDFLVSLRFKEVYERQRLVGLYGFDPVKVAKVKRFGKVKGEAPSYFRVAIVRSGTAVDQNASGFEWDGVPTCSVCRQGQFLKRWRRIIIDTQTWTGEDIFYARGLPGTIIASERFKDVCESSGVRNAVFIPAEESAYDACPCETSCRESEGAELEQ